MFDILTSISLALALTLQTAGTDGIPQAITDPLNDFVQGIVAAL